ncbi:DUF1998 domain-containing protein [Streptoalloteichus hindustanus]|uniref:MrfA-like Zn-binding domain-containing protein n=1 Tax=Streptoalloteichus hindustanus TaxID=2017 RepID=A0A1M5LFI0_STRHI|nr:DUF1998 domain-containing protein [Streptoalloteichus hindustanus]SHG63706.1 protein of unknown function [Streptoalloteichus hindustanus]
MTGASDSQPMRVGALRPNQLLHTYGVGAMADLPNLSVVMLGLDFWNLERSAYVEEDRLLAAVRAKLGPQVDGLRLPPHVPETTNPFEEWARVGAPVGLFPNWLRCTHQRCNQLARADSGLFELLGHPYQPEKIRYVHNCRGNGGARPTAVPARFVLACDDGHLDDFPWLYFVHRGRELEGAHPLRMSERGTTGEVADVSIECTGKDCGARRRMVDAFGRAGEENLPACRGRHPHLGTFSPCGRQTRALVLGATNSWFPMMLRAFTLPRQSNPIRHLVSEFWRNLEVLTTLPEDAAKRILPTQRFWPELEPYGVDRVWAEIRRMAHEEQDEEPEPGDELDLLTPEWAAFTASSTVDVPDFKTRREDVPRRFRRVIDNVVLVPRLREVTALYGFTRIDAPEWEVTRTNDDRRGPLSSAEPSWVPCAETRGEGIFLRFNEERLAEWETRSAVRFRAQEMLVPAHDLWRAQRHLPRGEWPGLRYVLLHTFAHVLIRELALESGYSAAGIGERIYADRQRQMAGVLLYTAAPDSEGTLGGLVALGQSDRLGTLISRALERAELCSSDPLCAEHDPRVQGRLYGAACHACLFSSETSCERGNHYLDRALLVPTLTDSDYAFFGSEQ